MWDWKYYLMLKAKYWNCQWYRRKQFNVYRHLHLIKSVKSSDITPTFLKTAVTMHAQEILSSSASRQLVTATGGSLALRSCKTQELVVRNLNRKNFFVVGFSKRKYLYVLQIDPVLVHWNKRPKTKDKTFLCEWVFARIPENEFLVRNSSICEYSIRWRSFNNEI